jgi:hypothetical protein
MPMPAILRASADFVLGNAIQRCLADEKLDINRIRRLLETASRDAASLTSCSLEPALRQRLEIVLHAWAKSPFDLSKLGELEAVVSLAHVPPFRLDLWQAQNVYYELLQMISREQQVQFNEQWLERFRKLGEQLGIALGEAPLGRGSISPEVEPAHPNSELVQEGDAAAAAAAVRFRVLESVGEGTGRFGRYVRSFEPYPTFLLPGLELEFPT